MPTKKSTQHVDDVFEALGATGKYQFLHMFIINLIAFPTAWQLLGNIFTAQSSPHHCAAPANNTTIIGLYEYEENINITYRSCDILVTSNTTVLKKEGCVYGMDYDNPIEYSAVSQFDLVCDESSLAKLSQTLVIAGQGVGSVLTTIISDRLGRKNVIVACNFGLLAAGLVIAYAPNYIVFAIFKFIVGGFQQGCVACSNTFVIELFPAKHRRYNSIFHGLSWALGSTTLALISFLLKDYSWRTIQLAYSVTSILALYQLWFLDESLRWLIANGKSKEALKVIKRAAKTNKKDLNVVLQVYNKIETSEGKTTPDIPSSETKSTEVKTATVTSENPQISNTAVACVQSKIAQGATKKLTLIDVLKIKRLLANVLVMWFAWFVTALSYFAIYLTTTSLVGDKYLNYFLTALMEAPPCIFLYFSLNRLGRKTTVIICYALLSMGLFAAGIFKYMESKADFYSTLTIISTMIAMFGSSGTFVGVFCYTPEIFPTNLRNQALGVASFMGRVGGMLAPFTEYLADEAKWGPGVLIGTCGFFVCILLNVLPETNNRALPQTMEELKSWYKKDKNNDKYVEKDIVKNDNP